MALDPMMAMMMMGGMGGGQMDAAQNPFGASGSGASSIQRQMAPLRAMSYINRDSRSMLPQQRAPRNVGSRYMPGMGGDDGQDYSQYTFDPQAHEAAAKFLGQYGLSPLDPSQVRNNTILPNSGFFGNHPRLSGMLEGGIYGAATTQPANTIGEGITSVANSLIAGPRMRAAAYNQQFERPFQAASMLEGMEDRSQKRELTSAQIEHERALTQALRDKPDPMGHMQPIGRDTTGWVDDRDGTFHPNPNYDPKPGAGERQTPGVAPSIPYIRQLYGNVDPDTLTKQQWASVNRLKEQEMIRVAGAKSGAEAADRIQQSYRMGKDAPIAVKKAADDAGKSWIKAEDKVTRTSIARQYFLSTKKIMSPNEIEAEVNKRNAKTIEDIHNIYQGWQDTFNQQNPNSPMPY